MPSDDTTVATQADFVPMAVGNTDRVRSVVSVSAHDGFSHQPRSGMQQGRLSVGRLPSQRERRSRNAASGRHPGGVPAAARKGSDHGLVLGGR